MQASKGISNTNRRKATRVEPVLDNALRSQHQSKRKHGLLKKAATMYSDLNVSCVLLIQTHNTSCHTNYLYSSPDMRSFFNSPITGDILVTSTSPYSQQSEPRKNIRAYIEETMRAGGIKNQRGKAGSGTLNGPTRSIELVLERKTTAQQPRIAGYSNPSSVAKVRLFAMGDKDGPKSIVINERVDAWIEAVIHTRAHQKSAAGEDSRSDDNEDDEEEQSAAGESEDQQQQQPPPQRQTNPDQLIHATHRARYSKSRKVLIQKCHELNVITGANVLLLCCQYGNSKDSISIYATGEWREMATKPEVLSHFAHTHRIGSDYLKTLTDPVKVQPYEVSTIRELQANDYLDAFADRSSSSSITKNKKPKKATGSNQGSDSNQSDDGTEIREESVSGESDGGDDEEDESEGGGKKGKRKKHSATTSTSPKNNFNNSMGGVGMYVQFSIVSSGKTQSRPGQRIQLNSTTSIGSPVPRAMTAAAAPVSQQLPPVTAPSAMKSSSKKSRGIINNSTTPKQQEHQSSLAVHTMQVPDYLSVLIEDGDGIEPGLFDDLLAPDRDLQKMSDYFREISERCKQLAERQQQQQPQPAAATQPGAPIEPPPKPFNLEADRAKRKRIEAAGSKLTPAQAKQLLPVNKKGK